jgi:exopolyphosphatase/guanosine-5'-triphosphate,3'-diphosphate pyrophosphatase
VHHLGINAQHAEQTFNLCVQLFKQLRVLHKFPRQYVKVLRVAAFMHDAGKKFKFYNNVKHTAYMILNSNLYGVSHRDIVLASYVTDVFNKEEVNHADWAKFSGILSQEDMEAVKKLAVILKLAVAFDASMSNAITEISCDVLGDSVIMKTEVAGDVTLEMKQASVAAIDFKKVFRKNLEIL